METGDLRCEYKRNPIGIDVARPRFCWKLSSHDHNKMQGAFRIHVAPTEDDLLRARNLVWDSGIQEKDQSVHVEYGGPPLESRQRYYWRVKVWDERVLESDWSEAAFWEMGLLHPGDWQAEMIEPDLTEDLKKPGPCPMLRKEYAVKGEAARARLYITAHGIYEAWINGKRVGDELFTPGWTDYDKCLQYQTYDVTDLLTPGGNAIGVVLGDGWYRGFITFFHARNV